MDVQLMWWVELSTHTVPGSYTSRGQQHTSKRPSLTTDLLLLLRQVQQEEFSKAWLLSSPTLFCNNTNGRLHLALTLPEVFPFWQVLVHPHCPLANYFWFAHFTSGPAILDLQLDCSAKMALWIAQWNRSPHREEHRYVLTEMSTILQL